MLTTRLCELLEIEHPIISAPMAGSATAELAAAVSEAGGFGMIGAGIGPNGAWLREQIHTARELTHRPFGVGFISSAPGLAEMIEVALDERVAAVSHSFADPTPYVLAAHAAGVKVLVQVQTVSQALRASRAGADVITAQGTEAGGHTGYSGTLPLVPAVLDVVGDIPVVAAGGVGDGRGLAAVLMLGADGAWIGTRFVATPESAIAGWAKQQVVAAGTDDTVFTKAFDLAMDSPFPLDIGDRVLRNDFTAAWHGRDEQVVARRAELQGRIDAATQAGDSKTAPIRAGTVAGLIYHLEPAGDIVRRIVAEAQEILESRPGRLLGS